MFSLSALTDDLAVLDLHMREAWDENPSATYFRLIVARVYEGERIVTAMDGHVTVARFLGDIPETAEPAGRLRDAYRRDRRIKDKAKQSLVERTFAKARHLTVHYPQRAELARILRGAKHLDARAWRDHEHERLRYLWSQDVMEHALWPKGAEHRPDIDLAHKLTIAFVDLFKHALGPYAERVGVDTDDFSYIGRGAE